MPAQNISSMASPAQTKPHNVTITERGSALLTGIEDVISFDERGVVLKTPLGVMSVDGDELHIKKLDTSGGDVIIEGHISGLFYIDSDAKLKKKLK